MSADIRIERVGKSYTGVAGALNVLQDIDLTIGAGQFVCLLGPSGCGKSTLLNAIAGFEAPTTGSIRVGGRQVCAPGPDRAMVFQDYALFPWLTVARNVGFGLQVRGLPRADVARRADELLGILGLREFATRFPRDLSGGMRQRVAIARALAVDAPVLLMDEPFGALDALTRQNLQDELLRLWTTLGQTIVFVTHSIEESLYLADRVVVMSSRPGTIQRDQAVDLARPRDASSEPFNDLKRELGRLVMREQQRHVLQESGGQVAR
jgi:NitT/TauT family transport system ATP-binding protein